MEKSKTTSKNIESIAEEDNENDDENDVEQQIKNLEKLHKTPRDESEANCANLHDHG